MKYLKEKLNYLVLILFIINMSYTFYLSNKLKHKRSDRIIAKEIILVDEKGKMVAYIGQKDSSAEISLFGKHHQKIMTFKEKITGKMPHGELLIYGGKRVITSMTATPKGGMVNAYYKDTEGMAATIQVGAKGYGIMATFDQFTKKLFDTAKMEHKKRSQL